MRNFHHMLMKAYAAMHRTVMEKAYALGLTPGQPKVLEFLLENENADQRTIAEGCEIEPATAGSILSRMEQAGLIERRRGTDRRALLTALTAKGREIAERIRDIFRAAEKKALPDDDERERLCRTLEKVYGDLTATEEQQ